MSRIEFARASFVLVLSAALGCGPVAGEPDGAGGGGGSDAAAGADARPTIDSGSCAAVSSEATVASAPVDIVWIVDSSGSMDDETAAVQGALNDFSTFIEASGIDHHVILIGDAGAMSVPPPLGGSARFRHVNQFIDSHDALQQIVQTYPMWQDFLRPDSVKHFVVVTDDESDWSASQFNTQLAGLTAPGFSDGYTFHSICSEEAVVFSPPPPLPPIMGPCTGGLGAGGAAAPGMTYINMTAATGGVWRSICSSNWDPVFDAVAVAVSVPTALPCAYDIPDPPSGETLNPGEVNLAYTPSGGTTELIPMVTGASACTGEGWYYDDPANPSRIYVCPTTCTRFTGDPTGRVDIQFHCSTVVD